MFEKQRAVFVHLQRDAHDADTSAKSVQFSVVLKKRVCVLIFFGLYGDIGSYLCFYFRNDMFLKAVVCYIRLSRNKDNCFSFRWSIVYARFKFRIKHSKSLF